MADTVDRICALPTRKLASLAGRGSLFVHVTDTALRTGQGVARIEGVGPIDVAQLGEVLDLAQRCRADAYEHSDLVKDHVWTQTGGDCSPWAPRTAARDRVDFDHTVPYVPPDEGGPPGQTGPHNSGPLRRRNHRWKTHGGYRSRVVGPGRHLWITPHGLTLLVDHTGTHRLDDRQAEAMIEAPDGVEIYFSSASLQ